VSKNRSIAVAGCYNPAVRVIALCIVLAACAQGGQYVKGSEESGDSFDSRRGETNGRMFDFVSNMPEGDDWQIRVRDSSLWAAYGDGERVKDLGTANLSGKETDKVWKLVDAVEIPDRRKGKPDDDEGYVQLRLREPNGEGEDHEIFLIYVSRADAGDDEEVLSLAEYLQKLIEKHFKKKPEF
jgi:hypothetical protein